MIKLESNGFHRQGISWFQHFLSNRNQQVIVFSGIPKGSVLKPLIVCYLSKGGMQLFVNICVFVCLSVTPYKIQFVDGQMDGRWMFLTNGPLTIIVSLTIGL